MSSSPRPFRRVLECISVGSLGSCAPALLALSLGVAVAGCTSDEGTGGKDAMGSSTGASAGSVTGGTSSTGGSSASGGLTEAGGGASGGAPATTTICATADENDDATLTCPAGSTITAIEFASFGQPTGECGSFAAGSCHAAQSESVIGSACLGQSSCTVTAENDEFGGDPCAFTVKSLAIQTTCTGSVGGTGGADGSGGVVDSGGKPSAGGASEPAVTAAGLVDEMGIGTNIGNTFDNTTTWETGWGQPLVTQCLRS